MQIIIADYKENVPTPVHADYDPVRLELELVDLKFLEKLVLDGEVLREKDSLSFSGRLHSRVRRICGRTLKEVDEDLNIPFRFYYATKDKAVIDTVDDLRESVLIEQPMVYYAPGSEPMKEESGKVGEETAEKKVNPFMKLKNMRERLKEDK